MSEEEERGWFSRKDISDIERANGPFFVPTLTCKSTWSSQPDIISLLYKST